VIKATTPVVGTLGFLDTDSTRYLADPHGVFDELRPQHDGFATDCLGVSLLSHAACEAAFHDTLLVPGIDWLLTEMGHGPLWGVFGKTLTDSEGIDHQRLRRVVSPWFTARRIDALRSRTRHLVDELLVDHDPATPLDVMSGLADLVPAKLFCWMIGAEPQHADMLAQWSKVLLRVFTADPAMVAPVRAAKAELADYAGRLLARKRVVPADDLASVLAGAEHAGVIDTDDSVNLLEELLSASVDNTANATGLAVHTLAGHPEQWAAMHNDPTCIAAAVEECGRYQPAIRHTIKYATADTVVLGRPIAAGTFVTIRIAAAHRDPTVYADPHRFDISRIQPKGQLSFGAGRHYCLGAALGRMEIEEMVGGLVRRWSHAAICEGADMSIVTSGHVRRLPLELIP